MGFFISDAYAQAAGPGGGAPFGDILFLILLFAVFYFLLIRPQQKRAKEHKKMVEAVAKDDEVVTNGGLLALGNQGTYERDKFAFVPEMNFKLGYRFRDHVEMSVGYTFMYFDDVVLVGDVLDRTIDPSVLNTNGPYGTRPAFDFDDSGLWVQGIDLGVVIDI